MASQPVPPPPLNIPLIDAKGYVTRPWQAFFQGLYNRVGGSFDKVSAASILAAAAVPSTAQIVVGPGLSVGGDFGSGNVGISLYKVVTTVALLPSMGNARGDMAYAKDGRKPSEGVGTGTGVPVWWTPGSPGSWIAIDSGIAVAA